MNSEQSSITPSNPVWQFLFSLFLWHAVNLMGDVDSDCGYLDGVEDDFGCFGDFEGDFCVMSTEIVVACWL